MPNNLTNNTLNDIYEIIIPVWVLEKGSFLDQGIVWDARIASFLTQQHFCWAKPKNVSLICATDQKLFYFYCQTDTMI